MNSAHLLRSLLSVPGNRPAMLEKARSLPADGLHLDLEDAVPPGEKERARQTVGQVLPGFALRRQLVVVRVNPLGSEQFQRDLDAVVSPYIEAISLPKAGSPEEVRTADAMISEREERKGLLPGRIGLFLWIETARAMVAAFDIASASPRVRALLFGADDFTREMGIPRTRDGKELIFARWTVSITARAAGVLALDAGYPDFRDQEGLVQEARLARRMGFQGKFLIHPSQIDPVNSVFVPAPEEVEAAERVVEAFEAAVAQGHATTSLEGSLIDTAIAERARRLLALAQAAREREKRPDTPHD